MLSEQEEKLEENAIKAVMVIDKYAHTNRFRYGILLLSQCFLFCVGSKLPKCFPEHGHNLQNKV